MMNNILFRSGCANDDEIMGIRISSSPLGTSLAHINSKKAHRRLQMLIDHINEGHPVFYDNGLVTLSRKGKQLEPEWVFNEYTAVLKRLPRDSRKLLSIVIPDAPFDPEKAVQICRDNRSAIKRLSKQCRVILPIHRSTDLRQHALALLEALDYAPITLGIPCLSSIKTPTGPQRLRLTEDEVETLFSLKHPITGQPVWKDVHFFALSERTRGDLLNKRVSLADRFGLTTSSDASRFAALFSNNQEGTKLVEKYKLSIAKNNTQRDCEYLNYNQENEFEDALLSEKAILDIEADAVEFVMKWNSCIKRYGIRSCGLTLDIDGMHPEEAIEYLTEFITARDYTDYLKDIYWESISRREHKPSYFECRMHSIAEIFSRDNNYKVTGAQLAMRL
ncbi:hypothetical protein ACPV5U_24560 [Vibrio mediterranei]